MTVDQARNLLVGLLAVAVLALGIVGYFVLQSADSHATRATEAAERATHALQQAEAALQQAAAANQRASATSGEVQAVQASRISACQDQNARHHATVKDLRRDYKIAAMHVLPAQRREFRANQRLTIRLINDIVPYRDCHAYIGVKTG